MTELKVVVSEQAESVVGILTKRDVIRPHQTDFTNVGAVIICDCEIDTLKSTPVKVFDIPVFVVRTGTGMEGLSPNQVSQAEDTVLRDAYAVLDDEPSEREFYIRRLETAVQNYEHRSLPPFFRSLRRYVELGNSQFDCPGHQGGQFFRKHPAGRAFYDYFGEHIFRSVYVMRTFNWATCSFMKATRWRLRSMRRRYLMRTKPILYSMVRPRPIK